MALIRVVCCVLLVVCCMANAYKIQGRIVGGRDADRKDFAHNVAFLLEYGLVMCGGSILSDRVILSSATCMESFVDEPSDLFAAFISEVVPDDDLFDKLGTTIDKIILHPAFNNKTFSNDLALLRTADPIQFSSEIQPIALSTEDLTNDDGQLVSMSGWGLLEEPVDLFHVNMPDHLQYQHTRTMNMDECKRVYNELNGKRNKRVSALSENHICTQNNEGEGACVGDIGNGLVSQDGKLVAVTSWTHGCGRGLPDVHTKTYPYLNWIQREMTNILQD